MKRMAITTEALETPERGMELETREKSAPGQAKGRPRVADLREEIETLQEDLRAVMRRAAEARGLPPPSGIHCDCYRKGLEAAADHVEGKPPRRGNPDRDRP